MIQKPQVLSTRLLRLADGPRARALANQQESKARLKLGISLELCSAQHSKLICLTGTNRHFWEKGECYPPDCFHRAKRKVKAGLIYYRGGETCILGSIGKGRGFFIISNVAIFFSTRLQSTFPPLQFYTASFQPTVLYGSKHEHLCLQMVLLIMLGLPSQKVLIPKEKKKKRKQSITHIPICAENSSLLNIFVLMKFWQKTLGTFHKPPVLLGQLFSVNWTNRISWIMNKTSLRCDKAELFLHWFKTGIAFFSNTSSKTEPWTPEPRSAARGCAPLRANRRLPVLLAGNAARNAG